MASGGKVVAKLTLDSKDFSSKWKQTLGEIQSSTDKAKRSADSVKKSLDQIGNSGQQSARKVSSGYKKVGSDFKATISSMITSAKGGAQKIVSNLKSIGSMDFRSLASKGKSLWDSLVSGVKGAASTIKSNLQSIGATGFQALSSKFKSAMDSMISAAKGTASKVKSYFSSVELGMTDLLSAAGAGFAIDKMFSSGFERATTKQMLKNMRPDTWQQRYQALESYAARSSTPDEYINMMFRRTFQGNADYTTRALSVMDALSSGTSDTREKFEQMRGYGTYLQGGWEAAAGMFRDEPLTPEQKKLLQNAKTYEERVAAMETIARQTGRMTPAGMGISVMTEGEIGKYNKLMSLWDKIVLAASKGFDSLLGIFEPVIDWFNGLGDGALDLIGKGGMAVTVLLALGTAARVLGAILKPFSGIFKAIGRGFNSLFQKLTGMNFGQLKDKIVDKLKSIGESISNTFKELPGKIRTHLTNFSDKVKDTFKNLWDKVSGPLNSFKENVKQKLLDLKDWIKDKWKPQPPSTTTPAPSTNMGFIEKLGWSLAPSLTTAFLMGGGKGLAMSLATATARFLGGTGGLVFGPALLGLTENRYPQIPGSGSLLSGNWDPMYYFKTKAFKGAFPTDWADPSKKGSLADQLNLPGWIQGQLKGVDIGKSLMNLFKPFNMGQSILGLFEGVDVGKILGAGLTGLGTAFKWPEIKIPDIGKLFSGWKLPELKFPTLEQILDMIKSKLPMSLTFPSIDSITSWIKEKFPFTLKFPTLNSIGSWIRKKFPFTLKFPSFNSIGSWIRKKFPFTLRFPSFKSISSWILSKLPQKLTFPTYNTIASWIKAKLGWSGPNFNPTKQIASAKTKMAMHKRGADSTRTAMELVKRASGSAGPNDKYKKLDDMFSNFTYENYTGSRKSIAQTLNDESGNCVDSTLAQIYMAGKMGIPMGIEFGTWNGNPHMYGVGPQGVRDVAHKSVSNIWNKPPAGPGDGNYKENNIVKLIFKGPVYGAKQFEKEIVPVIKKYLKGYNVTIGGRRG